MPGRSRAASRRISVAAATQRGAAPARYGAVWRISDTKLRTAEKAKGVRYSFYSWSWRQQRRRDAGVFVAAPVASSWQRLYRCQQPVFGFVFHAIPVESTQNRYRTLRPERGERGKTSPTSAMAAGTIPRSRHQSGGRRDSRVCFPTSSPSRSPSISKTRPSNRCPAAWPYLLEASVLRLKI